MSGCSLTNRRISLLLKQGACVGIFPEGTTTDGKQVGHFHRFTFDQAVSCEVYFTYSICQQTLVILDAGFLRKYREQ